MGYYVHTSECDLRIPADRLDEAYERFLQLHKRDDLKRSREYGEEANKFFALPADEQQRRVDELGYHPYKWFAWADKNFPAVCADALAVLHHIGFEADIDDDGSLCILMYSEKTGDEDLFLDALSGILVGTVTWEGEDGSFWLKCYHPDGVTYANGVRTFGPTQYVDNPLDRDVKR